MLFCWNPFLNVQYKYIQTKTGAVIMASHMLTDPNNGFNALLCVIFIISYFMYAFHRPKPSIFYKKKKK